MTTKYSRCSSPQDSNSPVWNVRRRIECEFSELREENPKILHLALNEAEGVAQESGYPQLVFPVLAQEKAAALSDWMRRQKKVHKDTASFAFAM